MGDKTSVLALFLVGTIFLLLKWNWLLRKILFLLLKCSRFSTY